MTRSLVSRVVPPAVLVVALLSAWEGWVRWRGTPSYLLPAPSRVASAGFESAHLLGSPIAVTVVQTLLGLLVGAAIGAALALGIGAIPLVRRAVGPLLIASQTFPTILLAPLLVVTFGFGSMPKVVLVALVTFFPVVVATVAGIDATDTELTDLVRALGANRSTMLRVVQAPAALPGFFSGLRIASAWSVAAAVLGQMNGGDEGLGVFINRSRQSFQVDRMYAAFVVIAGLSGLLYALVGVVGRAATPWLHIRTPPGPSMVSREDDPLAPEALRPMADVSTAVAVESPSGAPDLSPDRAVALTGAPRSHPTDPESSL